MYMYIVQVHVLYYKYEHTVNELEQSLETKYKLLLSGGWLMPQQSQVTEGL